MAKEKAADYDFELVVINPCLGYEKGQIITDQNQISEVLNSEQALTHFVKKQKD